MNTTTGERSCANWSVTYTIPAPSLPAHRRLRRQDPHARHRRREPDHLHRPRRQPHGRSRRSSSILPTADLQAYNDWGGKSLYFDTAGGDYDGLRHAARGEGLLRPPALNDPRPATGSSARTSRWSRGSSAGLRRLLHRRRRRSTTTRRSCSTTRSCVISGHSEYWSEARSTASRRPATPASTSPRSAATPPTGRSATRTASRTLVCYKTVEGDGSQRQRLQRRQRLGPRRHQRHRRRRARPRRQSRHRRRQPAERDHHVARQRRAPRRPERAARRPRRPRQPENSLLGVMYVGDNDKLDYPLTVPGANATTSTPATASGATPASRPTGTTTIGSQLVGWEWDAVPTQAQYLSQAAGRGQAAEPTTVGTARARRAGSRTRAAQRTTPPPGQPGTVNAVQVHGAQRRPGLRRRHDQWVADGLGTERTRRPTHPAGDLQHLLRHGRPAATRRRRHARPGRHQPPPTASFTATPNPVKPQPGRSTFNASAPPTPDGTIVKYEWDLDGDGTYETRHGHDPERHAHLHGRGRLRRAPARDRQRRRDRLHGAHRSTRARQPAPTASFTVTPNPASSARP